MNVALEWPPKNAFNSGSGMKFQLLCLFIEVAIFVVSELLLRPFSAGGRRTSPRTKVSLLMTQCCTLLLFSCVVYVYHHIPYILIVTTILIFAHALWMNHMPHKNNASSYSSEKAISKPLGVVSEMKEDWEYNTTEASMLKSTNNHHLPGYGGSSESLSARSKIMESTESCIRSEEQDCDDGSLSSYWSYQRFRPRTHLAAQDSTQNSTVMSDSSHQAEMCTVALLPQLCDAPPGLLNPGNCCFINSILQCLTWTPGFLGFLSHFSMDLNNEEFTFFDNLKNVISLCRSFPGVGTAINTNNLLLSMSLLPQHLVASANKDQHQQDAAEFLLWLLNRLHCADQILPIVPEKRTRDLKMSKEIDEERINAIGSNDIQGLEAPMMDLSKVDWELHWQEHSSALNKLFLGQLLEARECQSCKKITMSSEYFTLLPLNLSKNGCSLTECFTMFIKAEELVQDNMISCSCLQGGSLTDATRLTLLSIVPQCLVIQLTRFSYDSSKHDAVKNSTTVSIILELEIFPYTMNAMFNSKHQQSMVYSLHAVCLHRGAQRTSCGHYVAYCRVHEGQWYHFNDDVVTPITDIEIELKTDFVLRNAYILFYHRRD